MTLLAIAVGVGLITGACRSRAGAHTLRPQVRKLPLLALGALLNALSILLDGSTATLCLATSLAVLIAVATANRHITGIAIVGVGLLVNLVAVVVNNGMPVRAGALVQARVIDADAIPRATFTGARHLESPADAFGVLGDVLPIPLVREVMSFGDLIIVLGAGDAVRELSRRRARRPIRATATTYLERVDRTTEASVDQPWGTAPSARPVSASQYSEKPEVAAPASSPAASESPADWRSTNLVASQSR